MRTHISKSISIYMYIPIMRHSIVLIKKGNLTSRVIGYLSRMMPPPARIVYDKPTKRGDEAGGEDGIPPC